MCQYCGCYENATIKALMDEHVVIQNHAGDTQRAVREGDFGRAAESVRQLARVLWIHNQVEEKALYPAIAKHPEFTEMATKLYDEHDEIDDVLRATIVAADEGTPEKAPWTKVVAALDDLYEHIIAEDNGLFPASVINFDVEDWEACEQAREQAAAIASA